MLGKDQFWLLAFLPSASPFPPLRCAVAVPAGATLAAGLVVPGAGGDPRLAPLAPGVVALPGQRHGYGGAALDGITRLLRRAPVLPELRLLGSRGFIRCMK